MGSSSRRPLESWPPLVSSVSMITWMYLKTSTRRPCFERLVFMTIISRLCFQACTLTTAGAQGCENPQLVLCTSGPLCIIAPLRL